MCVCVHLVTQWCLTLCDPIDCSRQESWCGLPFPSLGDLLDPGIKPMSLVSPALGGGLFTTTTTWEAQIRLPIREKFSQQMAKITKM